MDPDPSSAIGRNGKITLFCLQQNMGDAGGVAFNEYALATESGAKQLDRQGRPILANSVSLSAPK